MIDEMIPAVAERRVWPSSAMSTATTATTRSRSRGASWRPAAAAGLRPKIHVDAYADIGGARLAAELGVVSADHLNYTDAGPMTAAGGRPGEWAWSCPRWILPCATRALRRAGHAGRRADAGAGHRPVPGVLGGVHAVRHAARLPAVSLSPEEALLAATAGGARRSACSRTAARWRQASWPTFRVWDVPTLEDVIYRLGNNAVEAVIKRGKFVGSRDPGGQASGMEACPRTRGEAWRGGSTRDKDSGLTR